MNYEAVYRTAPATPGLLIIADAVLLYMYKIALPTYLVHTVQVRLVQWSSRLYTAMVQFSFWLAALNHYVLKRKLN